LCGHFKVEENYLEDRVKTIFLDGKPVDDVEKAMANNGSVLVFSAAMLGLVGATFRRGGALAAFRSGITYQQEDSIPDSSEEALILIKLFNNQCSAAGSRGNVRWDYFPRTLRKSSRFSH